MAGNLDLDKLGVIHGRFQGLHNGHMEYLLAGKKRCRHLIIGITNFDPMEEKAADSANVSRTLRTSNPFTYYERYCMLKQSMLEAGVPLKNFDIVPFPIERPERIVNYVPTGAAFYVTIYDKWGEHKRDILKSLGLNVQVMWHRTDSQRLTSGTEIRKLIAQGDLRWKQLVPVAVVKYIEEHNLRERILALSQEK